MMPTSCPHLGLTVVALWSLRLGGVATIGLCAGELSAASGGAPKVQVKGSPKRLTIVNEPRRIWYLIDRDNALQMDVSGPGYLRVEIRRNLPAGKQGSNAPMLAVVEVDGAVVWTYSARAVPSDERYVQDDRLIPAEPERVQLLIPKGKHTCRIRLQTKDERGLTVALDHAANAEFSGCVCDARIAPAPSSPARSGIQSSRKTDSGAPKAKSGGTSRAMRAAAPISLSQETSSPQLTTRGKSCEDAAAAAEIISCPQRLTIADEPEQQWCRIGKEAGLELKLVGPGYLRLVLRRNLRREEPESEKPSVVVELDGRIHWSADIRDTPSGQRYLEAEDLLPAEAERIHVHVPAGEHVGIVRLATTDVYGAAASVEQCTRERMLTAGCGACGACGACGSFCGEPGPNTSATSVLAEIDARHLTDDSLRRRFDEAVASQAELYLTTLVSIGAIQSAKIAIHVRGEPEGDIEVAGADVRVDQRAIVIADGALEGKSRALTGREDLLPGPHRIEATVRFHRARNAVFDYVHEETYQVKGSRVFVAEAGKYYEVGFILHATGDFTTLFKDRVAMRIDVQPAADPKEPPPASVQNIPAGGVR